MCGKKREGEASLIEQRSIIRDKILRAMSNNDFKEVDKLEAKLFWLDKKIKKGKK